MRSAHWQAPTTSQSGSSSKARNLAGVTGMPCAQAAASVLLDNQTIGPKLRGSTAAGKDSHFMPASQQLHGIETAQHTGTEDQQAHVETRMRIVQVAALACPAGGRRSGR